jgi:SAM-dependent methyltransferase
MNVDSISWHVLSNFQQLAFVAGKLMLRGKSYYCPICQTSYSLFLRMGTPPRLNARCPGCGSLERHRLLWTGLEHLYKRGVLKLGGRLLHVAPEACIAKRLREYCECISADMGAMNVQVRTDVTQLCFSDNCFDIVICNHVLEHVPEDGKALSEIYRVLKPGGWASLQVPLVGDHTQEDLSIRDPLTRTRLYGQSDHVRQYGTDFANRIKAAGFDALVLNKGSFLTPTELNRLSVQCEETVILGLKPL